jgi:magnesium chelatase subunit D
MVLGHRRRRRPFDEPGFAQGELERAWDDATAPDADDASTEAPDHRAPDDRAPDDRAPDDRAPDDRHEEPAGPTTMTLAEGPRSRQPQAEHGGFGTSTAPRGRYRRSQPYDLRTGGPVDAQATAIAVASRRAVTGEPAGPTVDDLRGAEREQQIASLVVFVVDASASMGVERRMAATKAAVLGLLGDAYRRRGKVALITFHGREAEVVLRPTGSIEVARARLAELRTGGATPLAAGLDAARKVVEGSTADRSVVSTVVVVTDGRATVGAPDAVTAAHEAMARLGRTGARVVVLDTETGPTRLGLAGELAATAGAECLSLDVGQASSLEGTVRGL